MPKLLLVAFYLLLPSLVQAEERTASELHRDCGILISVISSPNVPNSHFGDATHCQGFIEALVPSALRIHEAYTILFPDLKALPTDKRLVERYFATLLLVDPNLCLPENLNAYVVASLIVKYGQSHPERMTDTQYKFASQALAEVYFCKASDK